MGTSGSYSGSGGRDWNDLNGAIDDWLTALSEGTDVEGDEVDAEGTGPEDTPSDNPDSGEQIDPAIVAALRPLGRAILSGGRGRGDGPSGGGGGGSPGAGPRTGGRSPSGSGRSRARVGRVGGRLAVGIAGLRDGDADALRTIGLDLTELQALDPYRQAQRLLEAATEENVAITLEEDEVHKAVNRTAIWALTDAAGPEVNEVIRRFIVEYVCEVFFTEGGTTLRSGLRDGVFAVGVEDRVRDTVTALARQAPVQGTNLSAENLGLAVEGVLEQTLMIHATG